MFREFDNVAQPKSEKESRYLQDTDGVSDLEYHLVENPNRLKISWAIDRFLRYCKRNARRFECVYGPTWYTMCEDYINSLLKFEYTGYFIRNLEEKSLFYPYYEKTMILLQKLKPKRFRKPSRHNYFPRQTMYHAMPTEEEFIEKTRIFTDRLAENMVTDKKAEYVMVDQMFAANNPDRYLRYVNDVKAFVVDRDPRDLYINQRNMEDHMLPVDPHQFCIHFKDIRRPLGSTNPNVMYLTIEEMIFDYDKMVPKVCEFVGIDRSHHIHPKQYFDPAISINGTHTWERYPKYADAVRVIESELPEYLSHY